MAFTTARLTLRAYTPDSSDLDNVVSLTGRTDVMPLFAMGKFAPMSPKKWKDIYAKEFDSAAFGCIIELTETHEFIGYALLHIREPKNRDGDFGFGLLPQFWGKGYGTEALEFIIEHAFRWFGLHRFSLGTFSPNERALKMYLKVGFTIEGRKRECLWYDNKFVDIIDLGILRREWAAKRWNAEEQKNVDEV